MKYFLQSLNEMKRRSLELTSDVLIERIRLEASISNLQLRVQEKELKKAEKLQIQEAMMQNKEKIEDCKNFAIKIKKAAKERVPIESKSWKHRKATTCTICEENCHEFDCWWGSDPSKCEVMKDGCCTVCSGKCHHSKHVKENKKYVIRTSSTTIEYDSMRKKNKKAQEQTNRTIKNLSQIALKPDSAFTLQHLDFFIPRVREAGKENWARELEEMRRNAEAEETLGAQAVEDASRALSDDLSLSGSSGLRDLHPELLCSSPRDGMRRCDRQ
uniref:Uncharacterized protein n=1 Tax=Cyprinus carpio carpio TaxID=630221 RepID=A0A9J8B468_CYPCA